MYDDNCHDHDATPPRPLAVRENQTAFQMHDHARPPLDAIASSWPLPADPILMRHAVAMVERLTALITEAVRASDDDRATGFDHLLQKAEVFLALLDVDGAPLRPAPPASTVAARRNIP